MFSYIRRVATGDSRVLIMCEVWPDLVGKRARDGLDPFKLYWEMLPDATHPALGDEVGRGGQVVVGRGGVARVAEQRARHHVTRRRRRRRPTPQRRRRRVPVLRGRQRNLVFKMLF